MVDLEPEPKDIDAKIAQVVREVTDLLDRINALIEAGPSNTLKTASDGT
ncbi:MAG: hypothetical protein ACOH2H_07195 [Cypionkella sp.]